MILAQAPPTDIASWLTGSAVTVLAFIVVGFIRGWIVPGHVHARTAHKQDQLEEEVRKLHAVFEDKVIPALVRATDVIARSAERQRSS